MVNEITVRLRHDRSSAFGMWIPPPPSGALLLLYKDPGFAALTPGYFPSPPFGGWGVVVGEPGVRLVVGMGTQGALLRGDPGLRC